MKKEKFAVIGLGYFGQPLALSLSDHGIEVLGVDISEDRLETVKDSIAHTVVMDTTDLNALKQLGLEDFDCVIVAIGEDFEASILTVANLQELKVKRIISRVLSSVHERILKLMKIEELILPEGEAAFVLARQLAVKGIVDHFDISKEYSIDEVIIPHWAIGKTLAEIDLRKEYNLNLITIIHKTDEEVYVQKGKWLNKKVLGVPDPDYVCSSKDIFVVFGKNDDIKNFIS